MASLASRWTACASCSCRKRWSVGSTSTSRSHRDCRELLHYDPVRVRQCVGNLLSNAIKFTESGRVDVKVSSQETEPGKWMITVAVRDTGIGMTPAVIQRLFTSVHAG